MKKEKTQKTDKCADVARLPGYRTFPEIAQALGVSPQAVNQMYHNGAFEQVYRVGTAVLVVPEAEVKKLVKSRQAG